MSKSSISMPRRGDAIAALLSTGIRKTLATALSLALAGASLSATATPAAGAFVDLGATNPNEIVQVLVVLQNKNNAELQRFVYQTVDPTNPNYHQFMTTAQFAAQFGASDGNIQNVITFLAANGITTTKVLADHLAIEATGTVAQFEQAFHVQLRDHQSANGRTWHAPTSAPKVPGALKSAILAVTGLDTGTQQQSHIKQAPLSSSAVASIDPAPLITAQLSGCAGCPKYSNRPLFWTPGDVNNFYNATPLLSSGVLGQGSTVGVIALDNFNVSDVTGYWNFIGLPSNPGRISKVDVFGGAQGGAGLEGTADVEFSGGVAPGSNVLVYSAPNTNGGFIAAVYHAVSDNIVDSFSISWGLPEVFYTADLNGGADYTVELKAFDQAFLEAGAQGIPVFIASGDSGAYDVHQILASYDGTVPYNYSEPLTVNAPASDPFVTAAGGTTVPPGANNSLLLSGLFGFQNNPPTSERVWSESWIINWYAALGSNYLGSPDLYSGGGGGVSVIWPAPLYQQGFNGVQLSQPGQTVTVLNPSQSPLFYAPQTTPLLISSLPGNYAGRNLPDVSLNADYLTGYYYAFNGYVSFALGGTSLVGPDLNGFSALLKQKLGHRLGFLNPQLYRLQATAGYGGASGFNAITTGDNWYYVGQPNYNPGAGLGSLNVANLAAQLQAQDAAAAAQ